MSKPISQKEIARLLGLSRMSVSLALRDSPRVSSETRHAVRQLAEKLGYRPDPALSALSRYRHERTDEHYRETLAFVTKWKEPQGWREQYVYRFFEGAQARAQQAGYRLEPFWLGEYRSEATASSVLAARGIRGLLLAPAEEPCALNLEWKRFASVAIGSTLISPEVDRVMHDYGESMRIALERLQQFGYRKAVLVIPPRVDRLTIQRASNAFLALTQRTEALSGFRLWFPPDETRETFLQWLVRERPDCILSFHEHNLGWIGEAGMTVPGEIGFVNLHIKTADRAWSGIDYGAREIGAAAVDRLDTLLQRNLMGLPGRGITTLLMGHWQPGEMLLNMNNAKGNGARVVKNGSQNSSKTVKPG